MPPVLLWSAQVWYAVTSQATLDCTAIEGYGLLQKAKQQGDFLLVGVHTDEDVQERRGPHLPIMDLHERALSVLACKYVDEVIIGPVSCPLPTLQCRC